MEITEEQFEEYQRLRAAAGITDQEEEKEPITKDLILCTIEDLVSDFTYYDRKEDEELTSDQLQAAVDEGLITIDEMADHFKKLITVVFT